MGIIAALSTQYCRVLFMLVLALPFLSGHCLGKDDKKAGIEEAQQHIDRFYLDLLFSLFPSKNSSPCVTWLLVKK